MRNSAQALGGGGFTLVEMLASAVLATLLLVLLVQLTNGALGTMNTASAQMEAMSAARALSDALEGDLRLAAVRKGADRSLNLSVQEDARQVRLALNLPVLRLRAIDDYGPVANVLYVWSKTTRAVTRAEYHAVRDPELVQSSGGDPQGAADDDNERRRLLLSPAGTGSSPWAWLEAAPVQAEVTRGAAVPLLSAVADFEVTCFRDIARRNPAARNTWDDPEKLPALLRVRVLLAPQPSQARDPHAPGLRPVELLVPVVQAGADS